MSNSAFDGKVALVTGASRGIGRALAVAFAQAGADVVALARHKDALEDTQAEAGLRCFPTACDVTRAADVEAVRDLVRRRFRRLDVLIGNAAIMGARTRLPELGEDDWASVMATNVTANWRLIRNFDALLRCSEAGRVVFMTSGSGSRAQMAPGRGAYAISKAALDALARTYASETMDSPVRVMLCNPGPLRTGLRASVAPGEDPMSLRTPAEFAPKVLEMCMPAWTQTGALYDFPQDSVLTFAPPQAAGG